MKNKFLIIGFSLLFLFSCTSSKIIIINKSAIQKIKTVTLNKIEVNSLAYDPFLSNTIREILNFQLTQNGYKVLPLSKTETSNISVPVKSDAEINIILMHKRYLKKINEVDNLSIKINILQSNNLLATILISDTKKENLLNTQTLESYFKLFFKQFKKKLKK